MKFFEILNQCKANNIKLAVKDGKILVHGDKERITDDIVTGLKAHKDDIVKWLSNGDGNSGTVAAIPKIGRDQSLPLSYAQQRLWFIDHIEQGSAQFNMVTALRVRGNFDLLAAELAVTRIIERHEPLRTRFAERNGEPVQVIPDTFAFALHYLDLSSMEQSQQQTRVRELIEEDKRSPFNLSTDIMVRASYLLLAAAGAPASATHEQEGVLLFNVHHIASDGWSTGLLVDEFILQYQTALLDKPNPLPPLGIQYADYAYWQREWLTREIIEHQLTFWADQLRDLPAVHNMPLDFPRPDVKTYAGAIIKDHLPAHFSKQIKTLSNKFDATPFMVLHAAFSLLLARHSNSHDQVVGTPIANRKRVELEPLIGFFVNTLVLRTRTNFEYFHELLEHVKQVNLNAQENQDVPFEQVIDRCQAPRNMQYTPLFQIAFSMDTTRQSELRLPGLNFSRLEGEGYQGANFDLELAVDITDDGLVLGWIYDTAIFKAETIQSLGNHMQRLLAELIDSPDAKIADLQLLSAQEIHHLVQELNAGDASYPRTVRIHELFEQRVLDYPDAIAVTGGDVRLTYREINVRANRVAHCLMAEGVGRNHLVGIYARRSADFLVGILATMKAGAAYVPLDLSNPPERLNYMVDNARLAVVLTQEVLAGSLDLPSSCTQLFLDQQSLFANYPVTNPGVPGSEEDYAYMIYTSGSTGQPKGALVHHAGALNHIFAEFDVLGFMRDGELQPRNFLQSAASSSDVSVWQFLAPLVSGGKTVIIEDTTDIEQLLYLIQAEQIHLIQTAPVVLQLLVDYLEHHVAGTRPITPLQWLMIIAEPCSVPLINKWFHFNPHIPVMNGFGPTEASDDITYHIMREPLDARISSIPIGKAIPNMNMYVLDDRQQLLPKGVVGELCVSGVGVGPGYWQNPERNAQAFVVNPYRNFPGSHGDRLYRTGDLGRWLPTGELEFIGRIDHQVKIRGFRIELGEIEYQLARCDGVSGCCVLVREDHPGDKRIVAYLVPVREEFIDDWQWLDRIKTSLQSCLANYMLPSAYVVLREFPLTPADKIDKKALPAPEANHQQVLQAPMQTQTQRALAGIWATLLKIDAALIGLNSNFFNLGGHSILAVRMVAMVRSIFSLELPLKAVFQTPDLQGLATLLDAGNNRPVRPLVTPMDPAIDPIPLSFAQQRLWVIDKMENGSAQYNIPRALKIQGAFSVESAEEAIRRIIQRHQVLRTVFIEKDGLPTQKVLRDFSFKLSVIDLSKLNASDVIERVNALVHSDAVQLFDLGADLMVRASYVRISEQAGWVDGVLLFNMHHIAADGWSIGVLVNEFVQQYQALSRGEDKCLPPLAIQYADYACWQRQWLHGDIYEQQLHYWQRQLADAPPVHNVSLDFPRSARRDRAAGEVTCQLTGSLSERLQSVARLHQVTPFMLLHAALALVLSRHSNSDDIIIGSPVANRLQSELEPLIGFFVNTLVLRVRTDYPTLGEYLAHVKKTNLDAQANQDVPFEQVVEQCHVARSLDHTALFQIMFKMDTTEKSNLDLPGLAISPLPEAPVAKFELNISVHLGADSLVITWTYDKSLFRPERIEQLSAHLSRLLESIAAMPTAHLRDLQMLSEEEKDHLLYELNATQYEHPTDTLIHTQFESCAASYPDNCAIICGAQRMAYRELNEAANRLAHYLYGQGVGEGTFVGIRVKRSIEMIVGIMAVLKTGAAYVPFDPEHPPSRLSYVIEDTGLEFVLSQRDLSPSLAFLGNLRVIDLDVFFYTEEYRDYPSCNLITRKTLLPDTLAYVIYTSGSTGRPKGVVVNHATLANFLHFAVRAFMPDYVEGAVVSSTLAFDATVGSLYPPLFCGRYIELLPDDENMLDDLERCLLRTDRSLMFKITPAHLAAIAGKDELQKNPVSRHVLVIAGEQLLARNLYRWKTSLLPAAELINEYGPTETTVGSTTFHGVNDMVIRADSANAVPIGRPVDNARLYILDKQHQLVPKGAVGQLYIAGAGVAVGYTNAQLTTEKFIDVHIENEINERVYKTGDLVRYLPDGNVEFLGRIDHQVKIRGFRIELAEIEYQLSMCRGVAANVVQVREDEPGHKRLVAYVVPETAADNNTAGDRQWIDSIRNTLQDVLASHMQPSIYVILKALPLNVSGKVDKLSLPVPDITALQTDYAAPETPVEKSLVDIWAGLLKIPAGKLSVNANFFELGGDSILSIQVVSRSAQRGMHFSIKDLFNAQSVRRLATLVRARARVSAPQAPVTGAMPLLPIQRRFFEDETDWHHYNQAVLLRTPPGFDPAILPAMVRKLYERHDALRLAFTRRDGEWVAEHQPPGDPLLDGCIETCLWQSPDYEAVGDYATGIHSSLRPEQAKLFKAAYIKPAQPQAVGRLLIVIHHLVVDGVSWRVLLDDLETLYNQAMAGQVLQLGEKTSSFQQWGQWLCEYVDGPALIEERGYWLKAFARPVQYLRDLPVNNTAINPGGQAVGTGLNEVSFKLEKVLTTQLLHDSQRAYRTTISELLLSALLLGVHQWGGGKSLRIDLESHGRESLTDTLDISQTLGWFTTVFPLTLVLDETSLPSIISDVKEQYRAIPHNGIGFGILKYLGLDPDFNDLPASEMVFNYLGQFDQVSGGDKKFSLANESSGVAISPARKRHYPLAFNGLVIDGCLNFHLTFDPGRYNTNAMQRLMDTMAQALAEIIHHCISTRHGRYTPADFPLAKVTREQLLQWRFEQPIEDLYPATSMQVGMIYHNMVSPATYVTQTTMRLRNLQLPLFRQAWESVIEQHSIFRTGFVGIESDLAYQYVNKSVDLPWIEKDLSQLSGDAQDAAIETIRLEDKLQGFNAEAAPLMRLIVLSVGQGIHHIIWSHQHALLDGWSKQRVFSEIVNRYDALVNNRPLNLAPPPQFKEYIQWLRGKNSMAGLGYWKEKLNGVDSPTELPLANASQKRGDGVEPLKYEIVLGDRETTDLTNLARSTHTTLNVVMQAAWALLLARYSHRPEVVFGVTTSGRPPELPHIENMVGLFINTIPNLVTIDYTSSIRQWLRVIHENMVEAEDFSYVPLQQIQQQAPFRGSLFESLLLFENYPVDRVPSNSLDVIAVGSYEKTNFPLCITIEQRESIVVRFELEQGLYTLQSAQQIANNFRNILSGFLNVDAPVSAVDLLAPAEQAEWLGQWSDTRQFLESNRHIHDYIECHSTENPDSISIVCDGHSITYKELNSKVNQLSNYLAHRGVKPGQVIGILVERSINMVISLLAVMRSGAAYLPLDSIYPLDRLSYMLESADASFIISDEQGEKLLLERNAAVINLERHARDISLFSTDSPSTVVDINSQAYVIFTSGSTGKPKGVKVGHNSLINFLLSMKDIPGITRADKMLALTTISFDIHALEIFFPLIAGATIVIGKRDLLLDRQLLSRALDTHAISMVQATPSTWNALFNSDWVPSRPIKVLSGGEALDFALKEKIISRDNIRLFNLYGPTETTVYSLIAEMYKGESVHIGKPIANTHLFIVNAHEQVVPNGACGELYIGGGGVSLGYINNAEETKKRFINLATGGQIVPVYKTGDIVKINGEGKLEYIRRADNQIKLRGYRIELGEIKSKVMENNAVSRVEIAVKAIGGEQCLVAYIERKKSTRNIFNADDDNALIGAIRAVLTDALPSYMVPSRYAVLGEFPKTLNNKIDFKRLCEVDGDVYVDDVFQPESVIDRELAQIWSSILGVELERIGLNSNFFELGGHSLFAVRMVKEINTHFNIRIETMKVVKAKNLAETSKMIASMGVEH
ncbi:hypothetical protein CBP51_05045 [Cellvibrio mixtus]|uniref:Carrier domain-containing protein n=1 Tax=Cellvibrio mixtus TaxID=39650 RepID=A0A266Q9U6_9GAMM|nr:non-ribosomal peptide synthetase [Cellvibrio mixtus]OZY86396.1 hypothetical protein CBP51_05045 [Cellvibrio mixtus]